MKIEFARLMDEFGITEADFLIIYEECLKNLARAGGEARSALASGDAEMLRSAVHSIKGLAGTFKINALPEIAEEIRDALEKDEADRERALSKLDAFVKKLDEEKGW